MSDIHGEYEELARQLSHADTAILLGDYLNLIDFSNLGGILAEVYTREEIQYALHGFSKGKTGISKRTIRDINGANSEKHERLRELIIESYERFFKSLNCECILLFGNTDDPGLMKSISRGRAEIIRCGVRNIDGQSFGFASGSPEGPWTVGLPGEMPVDEYRSMIRSLGRVDILCTHYPPAIQSLTWDDVAMRDEAGSPDLLHYIREFKPEKHYFGHVHNPRCSTLVYGSTACVNVGFFKEGKKAFVHETD